MRIHYFRLWIALACFLTSGVGLLYMVVALSSVARHPTPADWAFLLLWPSAWLLLAWLTLAWIADRRLPRSWTALSVLVAAASLLALPLANLAGEGVNGDTPVRFAGALLIQALPVLPGLVLAAKVVRFHWRRPAAPAIP